MMIFTVVMAILVVVIGLALAFMVRRNREQERQEAEEMRERALTQKQWSLGGRALQAVKQAVRNNETAHLLPDGGESDTGPLSVRAITDNAGQYTILIGMSGTNGWCGGRELELFFVLQLDIDVRRDRLHALFGRYGPDAFDSIENFDSFLRRVCEHVGRYKLYRAA